MDEYEHITCMKNVWLKPGADSSLRQNYVVLGTCNVMGEELNSRGRVCSIFVVVSFESLFVGNQRNRLREFGFALISPTQYKAREKSITTVQIIILEVIEVVPEPGQPITRSKIKQLYAEEQKGPVTAVCGVEGNLLAAIGQKVTRWFWLKVGAPAPYVIVLSTLPENIKHDIFSFID